MFKKLEAIAYAKYAINKLIEEATLDENGLKAIYEELESKYGKELADIAFNNAVLSLLLKDKVITHE
jgi:hypothetical protein